MKTEPEISVVTPAFQPGDFDAFLSSVRENSSPKTEWIVVDDGSGTKYDRAFATLDRSNVKVIRLSENGGQAAARNVGLVAARGKWVKFLDAGDRLGVGHLSALQKFAEKNSEIPFAPTRHVFPGGRHWVNNSWRDVPSNSFSQLVRLLHRPFLHHCGALYPRSLLESLGGYQEELKTDEDGDLLIRILMKGHVFEAVSCVQYSYLHSVNGLRVSSDDSLEKLRSRIFVCDRVERAFTPDMPHDIREALARRLDGVAMAYALEEPIEARQLLRRARSLCPKYTPDSSIFTRLVRRIGGIRMAARAILVYRRYRGRPSGGGRG